MFILFLFLISTAPLISSPVFPGAQSIHSFLLLAYLLCALLLKQPLQRSQLAYASTAFLLTSLASCLRTGTNAAAFLSVGSNAANGMLCFWYAASLDKNQANKLLITLFAPLLAVVLLAWYQFFFGFTHVLDYLARHSNTNAYALDQIATARVFIPFVTPNALGGYLAMLIPLCFLQRNSRWLGLAAGCTVLLTQSIGALISLTVACPLALLLTKKEKGQAVKLFFLGTAILGGIVALRFTLSGSAHQPGFSLGQRLVYWQETLQQIGRTPWFGSGTGSAVLHSSEFTHNAYLQLWAEQGIIGLGAFVWFIAALYARTLRRTNTSWQLLASVSVFLLHNLIDFTFYLPEVSLAWWVIAGLAAAPAGQLSLQEQNTKLIPRTTIPSGTGFCP